MEPEASGSNDISVVFHGRLHAFVPALLISIGYVDPGKWATSIEVGARYGSDLVAAMLVFNFAAILCQYLSARIAAVTERDLAEVCRDEYDKYTCILLGIQTEFSLIISDLAMVLGIAHAFNLLLGMDLFTCVFLTAIDAVFYPVLATLMENCKAMPICIFMAGCVLFAYIFGVLMSQPDISLSMNGILTKLSGESAFALMSLLGASVLPQNFYLHSALVRQNAVQTNVSKEKLFQDHLFAIICIFSCIFLSSYVLITSAANVFYNAGLVLLTFQDALTLVEQVIRIPIVSFFFLLVLHGSSQITTLTWSFGGEVILQNFFRLEIPSWLHRVTVRITAILPAIYCMWNAGAEGVYQLLLFLQVLISLTLPSSLIPLFRISSSEKLMGTHKMSPLMEFLALTTFIGMLMFNIIFVVEMTFGNSDWAGNLRWNFGGISSIPYVFTLLTVCISFLLMLWLAATPLKSTGSKLDAHKWNWDLFKPVQEMAFVGMEKINLFKISYLSEEQENDNGIQIAPEVRPPVKLVRDPDVDQSDQEQLLTTIGVDRYNNRTSNLEEPMFLKQPALGPTPVLPNEVHRRTVGEIEAEKNGLVEPIQRTEEIEGEVQTKKCDSEGYVWDPDQVQKRAPRSIPLVSSDGPGSLQSISRRSDDVGTGAGSLSRLAGLGRAARRQLAAILDEFWGQLYDFHGHATPEAKTKKLEILLGLDPKATNSRSNSSASGLPSLSGRVGSDSHVSSSFFDSPEQQHMVGGNLESSRFETQRASSSSSLWSPQRNLLDAYVQSSTHRLHLGVDSGERHYYSLRLPQASDGWDSQPATIHGHQIASHLSCIAAYRNNTSINSEFPAPRQHSLGPTSYRDSHVYDPRQKLQNRPSPLQMSSFQSIRAIRNNFTRSEQSYYDNLPSDPSSNEGLPASTKKYHSLPDISGVSVYHCNRNGVRETSMGLGLGSSSSANIYGPSFLSNSSSRGGVHQAFDNLSPSEKYRDALSVLLTSNSDASSLWSRQPFEQFGVADKTHPVGGVIGDRLNSSSTAKEAIPTMDMEAHLLNSLRHCLLKLLKLEGSDWLFKQNGGADEDLIDRVAAREKFIYEAENREWMSHMGPMYEPQDSFGKLMVSSVPHCGDDCIWKTELVVSFGIWCIHRILDLSLMESRPELWGKYTYVLNRLQGIINAAFSGPRVPMSACFCLQIPAASLPQQPTSLSGSSGQLPPTSKPARGKCTTAPVLLDMVKDVEIAISCRKGRTGTKAGDVAFPKGKENLASVLKRYKRRLSNKPSGGC
ncbi:hypothetical protein SAY86_024688 [Trapa natans]|uniref:Ethylene-insensitive protein 2 n=1 Tax=Trapa natans TaxID=22666 RepID=A0AAN7RJZ3_TRANT|nr:hypothetical protein SAY86_024688 [Trapa natans]